MLVDDDVPAYLDATVRQFLLQGRAAYATLGLGRKAMIPSGRGTLVLTWRGTAVNGVLAILLTEAGLDAAVHDAGVTVVGIEPTELQRVLEPINEYPLLNDLSPFVANLCSAQYDDFIEENLLRRLWVGRNHHLTEDVSAVLRTMRDG